MKQLLFILFLFNTLNIHTQTNIDQVPPDSIQREYAFELAQIYALDQGVRNSYILNEYEKESKKIVPAVDSINFEKFIKLVRQYGYPGKSFLGEYFELESVCSAGIVVLLHNPRRIIEPEIYHLLKNEVESKRLSPKLFAEALDKYYVIYERKSLYNSQFRKWPKLQIKGVSIKDKQLSDSLRIDIGLPPLAENEFIY
jgi:hypothetical protein